METENNGSGTAAVPCRLFVADLDGTLVGNQAALERFAAAWALLPAARRPLLCYATGRSLEDALALVERVAAPEPAFLVCGFGSTVYAYGDSTARDEYQRRFADRWNPDLIVRVMEKHPAVTLQPPVNQGRYKSSWYYYNATLEQLQEVKDDLIAAGMDADIIYTNARDLDVVPRNVNKATALQWLLERIGIRPDETVAAGDGVTDAPMLAVPALRGIVVQNADPHLFRTTGREGVYHAGQAHADGVLEGLVHFGVIDEVPTEVSGLETHEANQPELIQLFDPGDLAGLNDDEQALLALAYDKAVEAVHRNVTPSGFSACSMDDNEIRGTDENYRSVWARDGAITVIGTLTLQDPALRKCQRATLKTLWDAIAPNGQIPANVRIADGTPCYGGVGGICAVDSNLWAVIATYEYVRVTGDQEFLRHYEGRLHNAMNWLHAHDSNNDFLLEIPEAGDWTDLFGRSYHVLYDEVLWYRATICYGLLLEKLHAYDRAGTAMRRAERIKEVILHTFWPSTQVWNNSATNYFDRQYSVGDTHYLLAQVTPFDFSWRCDVYGNVLAFLFNVIDAERARTVFRFLWGVGANQPFPVRNLYPPVASGDADWRSYYVVNLLNLPHHYHNGGIWPFVGAQWVRFIHRLGLRDVAARELVRVAELNRRGVRGEWEFTEWAHGETGQPMGKAYQAWSAAEFIRACHDLRIPGAGEDT